MTSPAASTTAFAPGARLGPYEILAPIGAGGMGEVYRARDTRLGREVAVKVIAFDVSSDPDRLHRFEKEARAVAALSHPSILSVYDVGTEAGAPYVVFELLEGESLRQRLGREALPARKAVDWAAQVARGLAAAHDRGIVHRDLKPENLFVTKDGRVKILDFGLAKLLLGEETVGETERSATLSAGTNPGTLLGSVGYMSPEQVRGQAVDARSDIFSLGAVLYEMLSGRRAFRGHTAADTLTAILKEAPPELGSAQHPMPPTLERIVRRCLEKAPEERFQSARDLAFDLEALSALSGPGTTSPARKSRLAQVLAGALILAAVFFAGRQSLFVAGERAQPTPRGEVRFQLSPPAGLRRVSGIRLSPDGTRLAFVGVALDGKTQLWVRPLSSLEAAPLAGTENAQGVPFWSPDSRSLAFFTKEELRRVDLSGGPIRTLSDAPTFGRCVKSGAWSREGDVIFTHGAGRSLYRVSASGGTAAPVTRPDKARGEIWHHSPQFLPDGRHFLYFAFSEEPEDRGVHVGSLDSAETRPLPSIKTSASYAWPGYLLRGRGRALAAQPFDATRLTLSGEPVVAAETVDDGGFSASETGALAFLSSGPETVQPSWLDRGGRPLGTVGEPGPYLQISLSPDGRQAAVQRADPRLETSDIWLLDLARGVLSRFTFDPGAEVDPVWSPDGRRLAFSAEGEDRGRLAIYLKELGGASEERVLPESAHRAFVEAWSRDGRFLFYGAGISGRDGLWAIPLLGDRKPFPVVESPFLTDEAQLSPDGRFLAYMSNESGRYEVYVQPFPGPGPTLRLSTGGGAQPRWRGDGRELFYLAPAGALMAVDIKAGATLRPGVPRRLFSTTVAVEHPTFDQYAVTADGQRFLVLVPVGDASSSPITVVLNWTAGLKK